MAVRPYRGTSLECRKVRVEHKAKARRRMRVTAAKPRLGTKLSLAVRGQLLATVTHTCRKPCLKAQFWVRSFQPLFSCFQRSCPRLRTSGAGNVRWSRVVKPQPFVLGVIGSRVRLFREHLGARVCYNRVYLAR